MSRKHFIALAEVIVEAGLDPETRREVAEAIARVCAQTNSNFDRARFLDACGVEA